MKISVDTNVLVRAVVRDDPVQAKQAAKLLKDATLVAVSTTSLCEFVRVLRKLYGLQPQDISLAIRALMDSAHVETHRAAVEAGLSLLDAGGDFADGVIAFEGQWLGGETFVSFDKRAVSLLNKNKLAARLLG
jgi:predicted nucleic-acid-binding protein